MLLHAGALTQRCFQHRDASTHRRFRTQILLHSGDFAKRNFWTQARLNTGALTQRCSYTQLFLHTHTLIRLRSAVTYKLFWAEILLHASTFTQTYFNTH